MYRHNPPTIKIEFEHQIRKAYLWVEASAWHDDEGIYKTELNDVFTKLFKNEVIREEKGHICSTFVKMNKGATSIIMNKIS